MQKFKNLFLFVVLFSATFIQAQNKKIIEITPNVYAMTMDGYQSLVVLGDKGALVVDPANANRAKIIQSEIAKIRKNLPVTHIVLSHEHYDHIGGTDVFPKAQIYAQRNAHSVLSLDVSGTVPQYVHNWFDTEATIMMGETQVNLYHYGAGDGKATTVVHLPKEDVVYAADMFRDRGALGMPDFMNDYNGLGVRKILNKMVALNPQYALNGHSENIDPEGLGITAEFYNDLYDAVAEPTIKAMKSGFQELMKVKDELPKQIDLPQYKNLENYEYLPTHVEKMMWAIFHGG
ncbi:MBL fold metallo-hydrolase [Flavobacteriaceae bacterium Ap0902]|nr:MBL fold metallo-hydrolase [Flavobacteriaceae bacterium Ap0902]